MHALLAQVHAVCVALSARLSTPPRAMASVEEATGLLVSTTTLLGDFASKGGTAIFLAEALAPTTTSNIMDMSEGDVAALLAGAVVRQAVGGPTYIMSEDPASDGVC